MRIAMKDEGSRIDDEGSRIDDEGSRMRDQGFGIEDSGSKSGYKRKRSVYHSKIK
jgi:hypothetical protein